jgi:asparagine N-glycosylation enzyme membrane subunit Stt3
MNKKGSKKSKKRKEPEALWTQKRSSRKKDTKRETKKGWIEWTILTLLVAIAFSIRTFGSLDVVFFEDITLFKGVDAWYHARLADATTWIKWDMFAQYPNGALNGYMPMLSWLSINDKVAAYIPPVFGALALLPIYLIGRKLFGTVAGWVACLLVALLPGEFLNRSILGFTDHHVLEVFFQVWSVYFLLKLQEEWKIGWTIPLGLSLGAYTLTWTGIPFFLLIIGLWIWWECLKALNSGESLYKPATRISLALALGVLIGCSYADKITSLAYIGLIAIPNIVWFLTVVFKDRGKVLFGLTIAVPIGLVILGGFINYRDFIIPIFWGGSSNYIQEAKPPEIITIMKTYGISFLLALGGLWFARTKNSLFVIWSLVLIIAAMGQRRWGYYAVVPTSLLAGYFTAVVIPNWLQPRLKPAIIVIVIAFMLVPNISNTLLLAKMPPHISPNWYIVCSWLRYSTPEPFEDENAYYTSTDKKPSYGVLAWWDYGHWIIRIGHRVPLTSPTQTAPYPSQFYSAHSEEEANAWVEKLNIKYVLVDSTLVEGKWYAVLLRAEKEYEPVENSFLWTLWNEQATTWKKVYQSGDIKIYERINP